MREDSAPQQPVNRPLLVVHSVEKPASNEPVYGGTLQNDTGLSARQPNSLIPSSSACSDGYPGRPGACFDPDRPDHERPAFPDTDPGRQEWSPDRTPDQNRRGELPGRVRWMETVSDSGAVGASEFRSYPQQGIVRPVAKSFDVQAALTLSGLIHDARNLVTTLDLYCDLLDVPGVLTSTCQHYAEDLRLIAEASRRILDKLAATEPPRAARLFSVSAQAEVTGTSKQASNFPAVPSISGESAADRARVVHLRIEPRRETDSSFALPGVVQGDAASGGAFQRASDTVESFASGARWRPFSSPRPITSLAEEVMANHNLLSALAGPGVTVGLSIYEGKRPVPISSDDLTRILVNLTKNAVEAMPQGGHVQIALEEFADRLTLSVSDTGCGLAESSREEIFTAGYSTHVEVHDSVSGPGDWVPPHRGLGLAIVRSIVTAVGGSVTAANRCDVDAEHPCPPGEGNSQISGAVFSLDFPIQS